MQKETGGVFSACPLSLIHISYVSVFQFTQTLKQSHRGLFHGHIFSDISILNPSALSWVCLVSLAPQLERMLKGRELRTLQKHSTFFPACGRTNGSSRRSFDRREEPSPAFVKRPAYRTVPDVSLVSSDRERNQKIHIIYDFLEFGSDPF